MKAYFDAGVAVDDSLLNVIAHVGTEHLAAVGTGEFFRRFSDAQFMRLATLLARKSFDEGGCPIGGVIIDEDRQIVGKGHNTLGQENDSTTHGETAALRDAGRVAKLRGGGPVDFRGMTMFTTLVPCEVCCAQILHRANFSRVVIGDEIEGSRGVEILRSGGIESVEVLADEMAIELYRKYIAERPMLHFIDWGGWRKWEEMRGKK